MKTIKQKTMARTAGGVVQVSGRLGTCFAQGDVMFRVVGELPKGAKLVAPEGGKHILAHSETGHHTVKAAPGVEMFDVGDPMRCYLRLADDVLIVHERGFDTHKAFGVPAKKGGTIVEVRRQREYVPDGYRRVED